MAYYQNELNTLRESKKVEFEEALRLKDNKIKQLDDQIRQLQSENVNLERDSEELSKLKTAYNEMIDAKDKEIQEAEDRLQKRLSNSGAQGKVNLKEFCICKQMSFDHNGLG